MPKIRPKFTLSSDQYGPIVVEEDGRAHTRVDNDWFLRADALELPKGETIMGAQWSSQMGVVLTTSAGNVYTHDLGHLASWRQA
jgi:hypothetical protein